MSAPVVDQRASYHKSSVFCMAWNPLGDLLATGSNDKTVKLAGFDSQRQTLTGIFSTLFVSQSSHH